MSKKPKKPSEYEKVASSAPIKGLFSMPSKKVATLEKKQKTKSIFSKALNK